MRILVIGASGFLGHAVTVALTDKHEVHSAARKSNRSPRRHVLDLEDSASVARVLEKVQPQAVIDCSGIVENSDRAQLNVALVRNLLTAIAKSDSGIERIVLSGSAAAYGVVSPQEIPVAETAALRATAPYGKSKADQERLALELADSFGLPIVIARVFNPIGTGMNSRMLIPYLLKQVEDIRGGMENKLNLSRLDAKRDYVDVRDVAMAYGLLASGQPSFRVYNIGSGQSTSNRQLIELLLKWSTLDTRPSLIESSPSPEPLYANQADITRIGQDLGWRPRYSLEVSVKDIVNGSI